MPDAGHSDRARHHTDVKAVPAQRLLAQGRSGVPAMLPQLRHPQEGPTLVTGSPGLIIVNNC